MRVSDAATVVGLGAIVIDAAGLGATNTKTGLLTPPTLAVTAAHPSMRAVTRPVGDTVTTLSLLLAHVTGWSVISFPPTSRTTAVN